MSSPRHVGKRNGSAQDVTYGWLKNHLSELSRAPVEAGFIECDRAFHRMMVRRAGTVVLDEPTASLAVLHLPVGLS